MGLQKQVDDRSRKARPHTVGLWLLAAAMFVGLVLVGFFARSVYESRRCYDLGAAAQRAGNLNGAILHYRHALAWYAPMGSSSNRAVTTLIEIGAQQSRRGDVQTALFAYRSARMGILAVEHAWNPLAEHLPLLNRRIAALMSAQVPDDAMANATDRSRQFETDLASFEARQASAAPAFLAGLTFLLWLASLGLLVRYGFDPQGAPRPALKWLAPCSVLLLVVFLALVRIA